MGTRGFITFVAPDLREPKGEVEKTTYQQFDSYPEGVGLRVLEFLRDEVGPSNPTNRLRLGRAITDLRVVHDYPEEKRTPVTSSDAKRLAAYANFNVDAYDENNQKRDQPSWYQLLRETQGDPGAIIACGYLLDASDFPRDSLFAEWGYVIDLSGDAFEVYAGFQEKPHTAGRFADRGPWKPEHRIQTYYPVKLVSSYSLAALPTNELFLENCSAYSRAKYGE